jgi:endothelin-converting enzyme/putative endopeptidase
MTFASQALLAQAGAVSFDFSPIDKTVPPCQDLYRHACGAWLTNTKLPPGWDDWMELTGSMGRTADAQRRIVEAAAKPDAGRDGLTQKIGDYYAACLDTGTIEAKGSGPLQEELQRIRSIRSVRELMDEVARLIPLQLNLLYSVSAARDDTGINVLQVMPPSGGMLTLDGGGAGGEGQGKESGRGKTDPKLVALGAFVTTTLQLAGMDYASVESAKGMLAKLQSPLGDPALRAGSDDEILTLGAAERAMPHLNWRGLYALYRIPADARMRIYAPQYFRNLDRQMVRVPLAYWKTILTLSYLVTLAMQPAPILPQAFLDARSRMAQVLGKELEAPGGSREEQCLNRVKEDLGDAVGRKYVEQELPAWEKKKVEEMVEDMRAAMKEQIEGSAWLSADVKRQALVKLAALRVGVGYPEVWKDYSGVLVDRQDAYGNQFRVQQMETARWMSQIGRPPDKRWWEGTPIANDLYYQPERNAVELSACELLAAYDPGRPDAFNYAALGGGIGHELSHAFDNSRRQFDAQGMARDWWTAQDAKEYAGRAQCFAAQYSRVTVVDGLHIDGTRTLDESMADNAGIAVAYRALAKRLAMRGQRMDDPAAGEQGYTPAELFFLGWAIARCEKITPDAVRREVNTDTHPPVPARINLPAANSPAFREAFGCQAGAPMAPVPACGLW